jgi:hypothetical protein
MDKEDIKHFAEVLVSGVAHNKRDRVIIQFRERLRGRENFSNRAGRTRAYGLTEAALVAFGDGLLPDKLVPPEESIFPLPQVKLKLA